MNWPNPDQTFNCDENYHQWNICRNEAKGTLCKRTCLICGKSGGYKHDVEHVPTFYGYANRMWRKEAGPNGKTYRSCKRCENKVYGTPGKSLSITHDKVQESPDPTEAPLTRGFFIAVFHQCGTVATIVPICYYMC